MNRKLGKVSVRYFLNTKVKPTYKKQGGKPCYPVCYYVVVKGMTLTRLSLIERFAFNISAEDFEKCLQKDTVFNREKKLIEQIVNKYLNDEYENKIIDFSMCEWYGKSKIAAMNNINAYLEFYLYPISIIAAEVQRYFLAQKIQTMIAPIFNAKIKFLMEGLGSANIDYVNELRIIDVPPLFPTYPMFEFDKHKNFIGSKLIDEFISNPATRLYISLDVPPSYL